MKRTARASRRLPFFVLVSASFVVGASCAEVELTGEENKTSDADAGVDGEAGVGGAAGGGGTGATGGDGTGASGASGGGGMNMGGMNMGGGGNGPPGCNDGQKNGAESDVDCGGGVCPKCAAGKTCNGAGDCVSGACTGGVCEATCSDGAKNGVETDVDCGGGTCPACAAGKSCSAPSDCASGVCSGGVCAAAAACNDGAKNGAETDVDCGGGSCPQCASGKACAGNGDCSSGAPCVASRCAWVVIVGPNGNNVFQPNALTIAAGDSVHWVWQENGHSVTGGTGCGNNSGWCSPNDTNCANGQTSPNGSTYDHTFAASGSYPYYCDPHCGSMKATITVQ